MVKSENMTEGHHNSFFIFKVQVFRNIFKIIEMLTVKRTTELRILD